MNLSTARSATRAKEVGLRKVIGASRKSLFNQFLFESIIMSLISLIIGMVILETVLPFLQDNWEALKENPIEEMNAIRGGIGVGIGEL